MIANNHYNDDELLKLLRRRMGDDDDLALAHVESCTACQSKLETISQSGMTWNEVSVLLRPDETSPEAKFVKSFGVDSVGEEEARVLASTTSFLEPSDHPDSLGRFARYEIMELLGRGGMGIVMRGFDTSLNRHSAIKVLAPELASSAAARKRFSREAKSAAAVVHPHVVPIQTVDEHNGLPYLVMPVVEGQSLQQRVEQNGPLSVIETVRIAAQVASGLQAAHEQGLVHRDIKPANVLLENGVERVQITDFGLARAIDDASMTRSGVVTGTPQYMSPEQAHGDTIDHRSDLFSLGSLIYFMLAARSPFRAETTMGVLNRIGNDEPRSLRSINADVPQWLEQSVMKLLAKSRDDRFQTAAEVGELLQDWHAHLQQPETVPPPQDLTSPFAGGSDAVAAGEGSRGGLTKWLIATAAFAFFAFAGVLIVLETNKGTLTIQCEADDVPVRITQGDKVVEQLTVSQVGKSIRIAAGNYVVEVDQAFDGAVIVGGQISLKRGDTETVRVTMTESKETNPLETNVRSEWELHHLFHRAHEQGIGCIRFSPDGKMIASASDDKSVKLWDVSSGNLLKTIVRPAQCNRVAFSPNGTLLAIAGGDHGKNQNGEVVIWDLMANAVKHELENYNESLFSYSAAFSPDGKWLASGGNDTTVRIWNVDTGKLHTQMDKHEGLISQVAFSPDGAELASSSFDGKIFLWSVPDGALVGQLLGHQGEIRDIAFSQDGKLLVSVSEDKAARIWNVKSRNQVGEYDNLSRRLFAVACSPTDGMVVTGYEEGRVRIWELSDPNDGLIGKRQVGNQSSQVMSLAYSSDGQMLAVAGAWDTFQIWKRTAHIGERSDLSDSPIQQGDSHPAFVVEKLLVAIQQKNIETIKSIVLGDAGTEESQERMRKILSDTRIPAVEETLTGNHVAMVATAPLQSPWRNTAGRHLLFTLSQVDERWYVVDMNLESKENLQKAIDEFRQKNLAISAVAIPQPAISNAPGIVFDEIASKRPKFTTPEILMQHYADCQMRGDTAGCCDSYSDEVINGIAASYLMTAMLMRGDMLVPEVDREHVKSDAKHQQFLKVWETLLKNATIENPPAIASAALQQAASSYLILGDKAKHDSLTNDQSMLIATSPTMLKDPRQFVKDFALLFVSEKDEQSKKPLPTNRQYRIEYDGDDVWSVNVEDNSRMGLKRFGDTWLIHEPWTNAPNAAESVSKSGRSTDETNPLVESPNVETDSSEQYRTADEIWKHFQRELMATDRTNQVFALTEESAKKHDQVPNLLHLLSAALRNNGPAAIAVGKVLEHKELTLKELILRCQAAATTTDANSATEWMRVRNVAESTAKQWKHDYLSTEHVLMALMVDGTTTNQFFQQQGIETAAVCDTLYQVLFAPHVK